MKVYLLFDTNQDFGCSDRLLSVHATVEGAKAARPQGWRPQSEWVENPTEWTAWDYAVRAYEVEGLPLASNVTSRVEASVVE